MAALERQSETRESAVFQRTIRERTGEREEIHKKTFRKWINAKLAKAVPPLEITDLIEEIRDGHVLISLLEVLIGHPLKREKGCTRVHKLSNVATALRELEKRKVKLVGISNSDIVDGKSTPILGLVWSIILRFQVQGVMDESDKDRSVKDFQVEKKLLSWCHTALDGYEDVVKLKDFTTSWRDGLAFNAIIHTHKPELFQFESLLNNDNRTNLDHAFTVANEEFSVPKLLEPGDIDVEKPDKKLVIMYLTSLYHGLREYSPQGGKKRRKLDDLSGLDEYRKMLERVNEYISQVENRVSTKLETINRFAEPEEEYKASKALKDDIESHVQDAAIVIEKGDEVKSSGKADEIQCTEITNETRLLHERWEKLELLSQRLHTRCRGAVVSPKEQQIDAYIVWIQKTGGAISTRGRNKDPEVIKKEIKDQEVTMEQIQQKLPEIERVTEELNDLCRKPFIDDEDRDILQRKLNDLHTGWNELRTDALQKKTTLQDRLAQSTPVEDNIETNLLVQVEQVDVQSAPSEISSLEIQPKVQDVVESNANVHYLIDFEEGNLVDQTDSVDGQPEKEAKLTKLKDKKNAIMVVLNNCSAKLETLKSIGAPNYLQEVNEQQDLVQKCEAQLEAGEPLMQEAVLYARELTQDSSFDDEEKEVISRDMAQLQEHYDELRNFVEDEQEGLDELSEGLDKRKKIRDWEAKRDDLLEELDKCEDKVQKGLKSDAHTKKTDELISEAMACREEINSLGPEVETVVKDGCDLIQIYDLIGDMKEDITKDVDEIEERYEELKSKCNEEINRIEDLTSQQEKMARWNQISEKTSGIVEDGTRKLSEIRSENPRSILDIQEQLENVQKCVDDLSNAFAEIQAGFDYGNGLLLEKRFREKDKDQIEKDIENLGIKFESLEKDINNEQERLNELLAEAFAGEERKAEKLKMWNDWKDKLNSKYKKIQGKFNKVKGKGIPREPKHVHEQLELTGECSSDIAECVPEIQEAVNCATELIADESIDRTERDVVQKEMKEIGEGFKTLKLEINDYETELTDLSLKQEEEKAEKLDGWEIWLNRIRELMAKCRDKAKELNEKAEPQNKGDVEEQIILANECKVELDSAKPVIQEGLNYGRTLIQEDIIEDEKKTDVRKKVEELEDDLAKMERDNSDTHGRLEIILAQYNADKKDKFDKWEIWKAKIVSLVVLTRNRMNEVKSQESSADPKTVEEQLSKVKDCHDSLYNSEPEIKFALAYGGQLIDDDLTDAEEKEKIHVDVVQLEKDLEDLKVEAANEKIRLEQLSFQQEEERKQKLDKWEIWIIRIEELEKRCQEKLENLRTKGQPEDRKDVEDQIILAQEFQEGLESAKPEIVEGLAYGSQLLEDDFLDDDSKADIKSNIQVMSEGLTNLEKASDDETGRLKDLLLFHEEEGKRRKFSNWEEITVRMKELMASCQEKLQDLRSKGDPKDRKDVDEQVILADAFKNELESSKPIIGDGLEYGHQLLEDNDLDEDKRSAVAQVIHELEGEWTRLEDAVTHEERRLRDRIKAVEEEQDLLEDWKEKYDILNSGMDAADEKIAQGKKAESPEEIENCYIMIQDLSDGLSHMEPEVNSTFSYGRELASNESLSNDCREKVSENVSYLEERWKGLFKQSQDEFARLGVKLGAAQERLRNLNSWNKRYEELHEWVTDRYTRLRSRPTSPEVTFGGIKRQQSVIEDLVSDLLSKQGEVNEMIDGGNKFIDDNSLPEDDRKTIHDKMVMLHDDWNKLATLTSGKQQSVQVLLLEKEQQHLDKTQNWRRKIDPVMVWVSSAEAKLNSHFDIAPDLDTVKKQKHELEDFNNEMLSHQREVSDTLETGDKLLKDSELPEDDRTAIQKEVLDLSHRWENLEELVTWKSERIDDTILKLKLQQEGKLEKWHQGLRDIDSWVMKTKVKVDAELGLATDVDSALEQIDDFQDIIKDAPVYQEKVTHLNEFGSNLMTDPCLGEEERKLVRSDTDVCNEKWNKLVNLANAKQTRMEENLDKLEQQERDIIERWKIRSERAGLALDKLEGQISVIDDPIGNTLETVRRQEDAFEIFSNEVDLNTSHMIDTFALGEQVRKDPKLTMKKKEEVKVHLNSLTARWDRVKDFLALRNERIDEASKRLQRERRSKLHDWEEQLNSIDSFLRKAERETERLEPIGDDLETVRQQHEDFEHSMGMLLAPQRRVDDFEKFTDELQNDPVIDEKSKQSMTSDKDNRVERWARVVDRTNHHRARLEEKLSSLEKSEEEVAKWHDELAVIQEKLQKVESICKQDFAPDLIALVKQKTEAQKLKDDVRILNPQVEEFLQRSDDLLEGCELAVSDQRTIEQETESVEKGWNQLKSDADSREPRIEEEIERLQKHQKELLEEWKNSCNTTLKWIADTFARMQAQDIKAKDLDHARAQRQELEDITKEIKQYEKEIRKYEDLGDKVVSDPSMRDLERNLVETDKATVTGRWRELSSNTESAKKRIDQQIAQLEKGQQNKMAAWAEKMEPFESWLVKNETVVDSYEPIGYDINYVKGQSEDAQCMIADLLREQPRFAEVTDFGNQLTTDPCIGLEERVKLQRKMQSLHERWESLYASATSRHDRIKGRLKILEDEQRKLEEERKRLEEEDIQRRLNEERKLLEEEKRKKKEEEERKRKEEELRLQRELEERRRREEEERLLKEEEEKRMLLELEMKRREEEERKRKEDEERHRKEEEEKREREEEMRRRKEEDERRKQEEERRQKDEEEWRKREEEARKRKEENERRRKEEEERWQREEDERKRREDEKRKQREEERKKKEEDRKRREEEKQRKRKENEEKKKREEEEKMKAIPFIIPAPRVEVIELESSSPVIDEMVLSVEEDVAEHGVDPGFFEGKLDDWKREANDINEWLQIQQERLPEDSSEDTIASLKDKEVQIANLEQELPAFEKRYLGLEEDFGGLVGDKGIAEDQQDTISEKMDNVRARWELLNNDKNTIKQRIQNKIWDEEQKKAGELASCRVNLQAVKNWIELRDKELESMDPIGTDLDTLSRQKEDMKQFSKRLSDLEPRFTEATDTAYKLCKDSTFSGEQNKALQQDSENCKNNWDEIIEKVKDRMDGILKKIPKLEKDQNELLEEWQDSSTRFEKSLRKTEERLQEQITIGREMGYETWLPESRSPDLTARKEDDNNVNWRPQVEESNARLKRVREILQGIMRDKKNRKWTILVALKDVMHSITTRLRGTSKSGVILDKVVDLLEDHEEIMTDTCSKHKDADQLFSFGSTAVESGVLTNEQVDDVRDRMSDLKVRWNVLNIDVIEREKRLEKFTQDIEKEYQTFDAWRDKCDNMNQWLTESEKLIKSEEKVSGDIDALQEQIQDNQLFLSEVQQYEPKVEAMLKDSQILVDNSNLDKTDIDGVDKTKSALNTRWNAVNDHLNNRQKELESALLNILKKDKEGTLTRWREQAVALGLLVTEASKKLNDTPVDDSDYGAIKAGADKLEQVELALHEDLSNELIEVTNTGRDIITTKKLQSDDADGVDETINALNRQMTELERDTRENKDKIKEASLKYFGRSLAECEDGFERLEDSAANFSDIGSDIGEVGKQLAQLKEFESEMVKEQAKFSDIKDQFEDGKEIGVMRDEDQVRVMRRIGALDEKWAELDKTHDENHQRLTQALIVLHEELMEEIYDWLSDAEKQTDSIAVNNDDIAVVKEEHGRHRELKEEIASFEPTFQKAISISDRLLNENLVDPERADSYENEIDSLEKRWATLQKRVSNNGTKLSGALGKYITTGLDEAEVTVTRAESSIGGDDGEYLDLQSAKKALDAFQAKKKDVHDCQNKVNEILIESNDVINDDFFNEHERDHFQGRISLVEKRNKDLEEKVEKEEMRLLDAHILLLKQNLQRMNVWLNMAESRTKLQEEIGPGYDDVKKQLEDHQKFQEELRDHSMISMILDVDVDHPSVNERTQDQVKSLSDRWSKVWNWSEQRKAQLLKVLSNWQRFRDEQMILLNWLSNKEKALKDMGRTDLADEDEVNVHLEKLKLIEKELDEQRMRLESLHKAGEDLLKNVDESDPAALEINNQLKDFDDCWNDIAKEVINRIQKLDTAQSKLKEFRTELDVTNKWLDETEQLLRSFNVGMDPEEASKLQEKTEIKCEECSLYATKVARINILGKELAGEIDQPSHDAIQEELEPFNARWSDVFNQLDNFSDRGYPQQQNECCFIRVMKSRLGVFQ
ncbi:utrophin-like [Montipora foliosa]|uniref:utrophin-like n=1 Tax=Montipora foliosa TaxID=591990 RepID=UPI0035F1755A